MKILFICHRFPYPPECGARIRPFNMIRWLSTKHQVTVASVARSPQELAKGKGISQFCQGYEVELISPIRAWLQALGCTLSSKPSSLGYFYVPQLHKKIQGLLKNEQFDLIWVHCSSVAQYVFDFADCPRVMDFTDMDSEKWFQYARHRTFPISLLYLLEALKLRRYEKKLAIAFNECTVISPGERKTLESYGLQVPVTVVPNGVDLDFFTNTREGYDSRSLIFLGRMNYYPNIDAVSYFCRHVLPRIQREIPEAQLVILGSNPVRRVRNLTRLPGVTVTGAVPDVRPYLQRAAVSVVPLRVASGIQNKVLESMAMKVPVVASSPAFQGVNALEGEHLLVDDSADGFATKVLSLMKNPSLRQQIAEAGRKRIESCYSWEACLQVLDSLLEPLTLRAMGQGKAGSSVSVCS
ncbi:MAG: TIGR03087 family PEP-CTERM/XrtA system glycosyltransferase [Acidobacteria bacterium]|nr:MAG: TIGR03087 family PEP-CTERM/XrtA system glycosyltransferase [Acidobacteriota bacterium]